MTRKTIKKRIENILDEIRKEGKWFSNFGTKKCTIAYSMKCLEQVNPGVYNYCKFVLKKGYTLPDHIDMEMLFDAEYALEND